MLSDHEWKALREVERQFMADDPTFPRSFDDVGQPPSTCSLQWAYAWPRWVYTTATAVAVGLGVLMIVARAPGTAMVFALLATMIAMARSHRDEPGQREERGAP